MDMASQDKFEPEKRNEDSMRIPDCSSYWRYSSTNLRNTSAGLMPPENPMAVCKGNITESSSCPPASMIESCCPAIWDQPTSSQNLGFCDSNVLNNTSTSSTLGFRKASLCPPRTAMYGSPDMGWITPNYMLNGNTLLQTSFTMLPQSLSQFPTDTGFIEQAARYSSYSGGNFSHRVNPFSIPESVSPYSMGAAPMQGPQDVLSGIRLKSISGGQSLENEMNVIEGSKDVSMSIEHGASEGSPLNNERKSESFVRSHDEAKQGFRASSNSDEAEFSSGGGQAEPSVLESKGERITAKGHASKKRKRIGQDTELDQVRVALKPPEATKDNSEIQHKRDHNPTSTTNRPSGKHVSQASDSLKEEYIHVRARRGQAKNSHSLAERVRREKISERMKFLQDLVPGCSKVTGKAVMLDEIINYVQSLQQQVEFLSMKLATVNPRLDFNIEGLLAKDARENLTAYVPQKILESRGPSSALGFHSDMSMQYRPQHPSQPGIIQAGFPGLVTSSDALWRTINSHLTAMNGGYKESTSLVPIVWEDDLNNIVRMGLSLSSDTPLDNQDLDGPPATRPCES